MRLCADPREGRAAALRGSKFVSARRSAFVSPAAVKENRHALPALDLPGTYPIEVKRELAARLCKLYAQVMETQLWRPNVGIAELGEHNLYHLGPDGLEPITMVMVEFRRGRLAEKRLALGRAIVDTCVDLLGVPRRTVMVEFTPHAGEEILRDGNWTGDWTPAEAVTG
jgi:hypothetical protein